MKKIATIGKPIDMEMIIIAEQKYHKIEISAFNQTERPFDREPLRLIPVPKLPKLVSLKDKKGKPLPLPKSKFHK